MGQCLRCSKLCEDTNAFCADCQSLLQYQLQNRPFSHASQQESSSEASSFEDSPTLPQQDSVQRNPIERITSPLLSSRVYPLPYPSELTIQADLTEQAVSKLNEAAELIEQDEEQVKSDHKSHLFSRASRLSPIRDISSDIQRESTPLPQILSTQQSEPMSQNGLEYQSSSGNAPGYVDSASAMPDLWPWLDADTGDKDSDNWANQSDPLISRRFPNSDESARIEEEDIQRAMEQRLSFAPFAASIIRRYPPRMRLAFIGVVIFALIALSIDGILLLRVALNHSQNKNNVPGTPTLILSSNTARIGDRVQVTIEHFTPSTSVALTHDVDEPIQVNGNFSLINIGPTGSATAFFSIDSNWGPGLHRILAEDVTTRYTASANLQINGLGQARPPHLSIDTRPLHLGPAVVGANTISMFTLANSGDGSITWSASSDKSWLLVSPSQGIFSQNQIISIAAQRVGLTPGNYSGTITISSNVSSPQTVDVDMIVQPLPPNAGPVIALSPALLTFTTTDGNANSSNQSLTISNPGSGTLSWSVVSDSSPSAIPQPSPGPSCQWLSTDPQLGTVQAGGTSSIHVIVNSQCLLPGAYIGTLQFNPIPIGASFDGSQSVNVSITVQPHCGIVTSLGNMSFNTVGGEGNLGNQTLSLSETTSCAGSTLSWSASSTSSWLTVTPSSGQLKGTAGIVVSVSVNAGNLPPGQIQGMISFIAGQSTQTVTVQLNVQPTPSPAAPLMGASPLSINFSNIQGQPNPAGQVVTITNNGGSSLRWGTAISQSASNWLGAAPSGGVIAPGQTGQLMINVNASTLTPGNYTGQIILNGYNSNGGIAPGSPQTINVNLVVQPPCSMSPPSSRSLSFNAVQGQSNPSSQTITFTGTGSCAWPVTWNATFASTASWLSLTPANGTVPGAGQSASIAVAVNISNLLPNTYTTKVTISASDASGGAVQGTPETFNVKLTIQPSCILSQVPASLPAFTAVEGQTSSPQNVSWKETGLCAFPVSWTATAGAASNSWLVLSAASGTDSGNGPTLSVSAKAVGLVPGKYNGRINISATDKNGTALSGSPQSINVSLTVTGFTVTGSVSACAAPAPCVPLPGARVRIVNGSKLVEAVNADASGNYSFSNIGVGSYTIQVAGFDATHIHYVGTANVTVSGTTSVPTIQAVPG